MLTEETAKRARGWLASLPGLALAILTPKCPLCLAGYASWIGLGAAAPLMFWVARPLGIALALLPLGWMLKHQLRSKRTAQQPVRTLQANQVTAQLTNAHGNRDPIRRVETDSRTSPPLPRRGTGSHTMVIR